MIERETFAGLQDDEVLVPGTEQGPAQQFIRARDLLEAQTELFSGAGARTRGISPDRMPRC